VYIANPSSSAVITIDAVNIAGDSIPYNGDSTDQDFALVCANCSLFPDFTLSVTPNSATICSPEEASYDITVDSILGYDDLVTLTAIGSPAGTTTVFSNNPVIPPGTSILSVTNTAGASSGSYAIDIVGIAVTSTHTTTVGLDLYTSSPGTPSLVAPSNGASNVTLTPQFIWNPAGSNEAGFMIEVATDSSFTNIVFSQSLEGTTIVPGTPLDPLSQYYWRVRSANPCGVSPVSTTFSFITADVPPILLVDDDDNSPDVRGYYTSALAILAGSGSYDVWDTANSDNEPDAGDLSVYDIVIWFTGDEFGGFAGPGAAGETALASWLDSGGCFMISSQDYHWDRELTTFMQTYLGVASVINDEDQAVVDGQGSVFDALGPYTLDYPFINYSDIVNPGASAELAFNGDVGNIALNKETAEYKTTYWGFPWEAIPITGEREYALATFFGWCGSGFEPSIFVTPSSISEVVMQNNAITTSLTIGNSGGSELQWAIEESATSNCDSSTDIPWLSVLPTSGTVPVRSSDMVDITLDTAGLAPDSYSGSLCITSNDGSTSLVEIPVAMDVEAGRIYIAFMAK